MKNEKIFNVLMEVLEGMRAANNKGDTTLLYSPIKSIETLSNDLKIEIAAETNKDVTSFARIKKIKKYFSKVAEKRPIFGYATNQLKGFQTVTDSFMIASLSEQDAAGLDFKIIENDPSAGRYPDVTRIINNYNINNCDYIFKYGVNDLKNKMKLVKNINKYDFDAAIILENEQNQKIGLGKKLLDEFLTLLNFKNNDDIVFYGTGKHRPFIAINERTGSKGLILPIRID